MASELSNQDVSLGVSLPVKLEGFFQLSSLSGALPSRIAKHIGSLFKGLSEMRD